MCLSGDVFVWLEVLLRSGSTGTCTGCRWGGTASKCRTNPSLDALEEVSVPANTVVAAFLPPPLPKRTRDGGAKLAEYDPFDGLLAVLSAAGAASAAGVTSAAATTSWTTGAWVTTFASILGGAGTGAS
jgi:hypothetical protein